jgi:hypothetical protein
LLDYDYEQRKIIPHSNTLKDTTVKQFKFKMGIRQPLGTCHPPWFRYWLDNTGARLSRIHSRRPRSSGAGFQATSKHPKKRSSRRSDGETAASLK